MEFEQIMYIIFNIMIYKNNLIHKVMSFNLELLFHSSVYAKLYILRELFLYINNCLYNIYKLCLYSVELLWFHLSESQKDLYLRLHRCAPAIL